MATLLRSIENSKPIPRALKEHGYSQASSLEDAKHNPKVHDLTRVLHQTLNIDDLIRLFEKKIKAHVSFDGLRYRCSDLDINMMVSHEAKHSCSYKLQFQNRDLGEILFYRRNRFNSAELHKLENILGALFYPLRNAHKYTAAVRSAFIDPLTGAENRAALDTAINREVELSRRQVTPLSTIMFDIDFFKRVNDQYGHTEGDKVLQSVVNCTKQTIRGSDILFRYGGEEFLILLSNTNLAGAALLADRIRANIEQACSLDDHHQKLTVSLGVAELDKNETALSLIKRADQALYTAKNAGRNQVKVANDR